LKVIVKEMQKVIILSIKVLYFVQVNLKAGCIAFQCRL